MRVQQILVMVDFSEGSNTAIGEAARIARGQGATVQLVHAYGPRGVVPEDTFVENAKIASDRLAAAVERLSAEGVSASGEIHPGSALEAFEAVEDAMAPDLVVVGARGASRIRALLLGSVARAVVDHAFAVL